MFWQRQKLPRYQNENINKQLHRTKSIFSNKIGFTEISFLFVLIEISSDFVKYAFT